VVGEYGSDRMVTHPEGCNEYLRLVRDVRQDRRPVHFDNYDRRDLIGDPPELQIRFIIFLEIQVSRSLSAMSAV
jgi:hypothetical protein